MVEIKQVDNDLAAFQNMAAKFEARIAELERERDALEGYRAAVSWIGADSWDGCRDCVAILKAASASDVGRPVLSNDQLAAALTRIRKHYPAEPEGNHPHFRHRATDAALTSANNDLLEALRKIVRGEVEVFDVDLQTNVTVSMNMDEVMEIAASAYKNAGGR